MQFAFNYPITVAVATPDGNLTRLRMGCGEIVVARMCTRVYDGQRYVLNLELVDGHMLISVPELALRAEGTVVCA